MGTLTLQESSWLSMDWYYTCAYLTGSSAGGTICPCPLASIAALLREAETDGDRDN